MKKKQASQLVISILGADKPGLAFALSQIIHAAGCSITTCRMITFGDCLGALFYCAGQWNEIAKLETQLKAFEKKSKLQIHTRRVDATLPEQPYLLYVVQVITHDKPGVLEDISGFFFRENINIVEVNCDTYQSSHSIARMNNFSMKLMVPADINLSDLRERFIIYCDDLNLDSIFGPERD